MLLLKKLNKSFTQEPVLQDINLELKDQEFVVLVGPSGSGKSTLIRIIAGLEQQDSGEIIFNGRNIEALEPKDRNLSMVFQNYALYPHKTVYQNIAFPLEIAGKNKSEIQTKVKNLAKKLGLESFLQRKPKELSGGQRQRVALARAMVREPQIFLLDEPLSNLDTKLRTQMRHEIHNLRSVSKATFIYVTHDQIEALSLGDRIAVLKDGQVQQFDSPEKIYQEPANTFVASFIGSPATNLLRLKNYPDYIVGIRPENFRLEPDSTFDQPLKVLLNTVELLGNEFLFYFKLEPSQAADLTNKDQDLLYNHTLTNSDQTLIAKLALSSETNALYDWYIRNQRTSLSISNLSNSQNDSVNTDENPYTDGVAESNTKRTTKESVLTVFYSKNLLYYFNRSSGDNIKVKE